MVEVYVSINFFKKKKKYLFDSEIEYELVCFETGRHGFHIWKQGTGVSRCAFPFFRVFLSLFERKNEGKISSIKSVGWEHFGTKSRGHW